MKLFKQILKLNCLGFKRILFYVVVLASCSIFDLLGVGLIVPYYEYIINDKDLFSLSKYYGNENIKIYVTFIFVLIFITRGFTSFISSYLHGLFTYQNYYLLYKKLVNNLLISTASHYNSFTNEEHVRLFNDELTNYTRIMTSSIIIGTELFILITTIAVLSFINIYLLITSVLIFISLIYFTNFLISGRNKINGLLRFRIRQLLFKESSNIVNQFIYNKLTKPNINILNNVKRHSLLLIINLLIKSLPKYVIESFFCIFVVIIIFTIYNFNYFSISELSLFLIFSARLLPSFSRLLTNFIQISNLKSSLSIIDRHLQSSKDDFNQLYIKDNVTINNAHVTKGKFFLDIPEFILKKGKHTLISGSSGSGKSSFIEFLLGFNSCCVKKITVDGVSIKSLVCLRNNFSYVPQEFIFPSCKLKEFISGNESFNIKKFSKIVSLGFLQDILENHSLDTYLFKIQNKLSGGQKQRILLAAALYSEKNYMVLDEPTSSQDSQLEKHLFNSLFSIKGLTIICISHNEEIKELFNTVYYIKNNKMLLSKCL